MTYALYLRKSRADDPGEPLEETLKKHKEILIKYAVEHSLVITPEDVYEEVVSGDSLYARPQMLRLLEAVEAQRYAGVLCMDIQRLGRGSMTDQGVILDAFKYSGTQIITPNKTYNLEDDSDETYTEFEAFMGRQELKMIKKRLRRGIQKTIDDGGYIANAPYGYTKTKIGKRPTLQVCEEEAKFVRMMFDMYANKGMGCQQIADAVNSMGAKPHRTKQFGRTTIRQILKSPTYTGKIVWNQKTHIRPGTRGNKKTVTIYNPPEKWSVTDGMHPAIIDEELFQRVQQIFAGRYHSPSFKGVVENPLAGLVICGNCGAHMQRQACAGGPILLCQKRGCIVSSRLELVEEALVRMLRDEMNALSAQGKAEERKASDNHDELRKSIEQEIKTARQQDSRLHDLLEQGVYDTDTFMERHRLLLGRIAKLEDQKERIADPEPRLNIPAMQARIQSLLDMYQDSPPQARNGFLKSIIDKIIYRKTKGARPAEFELELYLLPIYL